MVRIVLRAIWVGCLGMLLAMLAAFAIVVAVLLFDPKCGPGDSGGCAIGGAKTEDRLVAGSRCSGTLSRVEG